MGRAVHGPVSLYTHSLKDFPPTQAFTRARVRYAVPTRGMSIIMCASGRAWATVARTRAEWDRLARIAEGVEATTECTDFVDAVAEGRAGAPTPIAASQKNRSVRLGVPPTRVPMEAVDCVSGEWVVLTLEDVTVSPVYAESVQCSIYFP